MAHGAGRRASCAPASAPGWRSSGRCCARCAASSSARGAQVAGRALARRDLSAQEVARRLDRAGVAAPIAGDVGDAARRRGARRPPRCRNAGRDARRLLASGDAAIEVKLAQAGLDEARPRRTRWSRAGGGASPPGLRALGRPREAAPPRLARLRARDGRRAPRRRARTESGAAATVLAPLTPKPPAWQRLFTNRTRSATPTIDHMTTRPSER